MVAVRACFAFVVYLLSSSVWAAPQCIDVFTHSRFSDTIVLEESWFVSEHRVDVVFQENSLVMRVHLSRGVATSDLSQVSIVMSLVGLRAGSTVKVHGQERVITLLSTERSYTKESAEFMAAQISRAVEQLRPMVALPEPASLREVGDFGRETLLERFHENMFPQITPVLFVQRYGTLYRAFGERLPDALKAAFSTEFFLPGQTAAQIELASMIIQSSYRLSADYSQRVLERIESTFVQFLREEVPATVSIYQYGLVPLNELLPKASYVSTNTYTRTIREDFAPDSFPAFDNVRPGIYNMESTYNGVLSSGRRTPLIDDLPPELVDFDKLVYIREALNVHTLEQLGRVSATTLFSRLGSFNLTRNEIRDLYFYLKQTYRIHLNLSESLGLQLNIYNRQHHEDFSSPWSLFDH